MHFRAIVTGIATLLGLLVPSLLAAAVFFALGAAEVQSVVASILCATLGVACSVLGGVLAFIALRVWPLPKGRVVHPVEAPLLWREIQQLAARMGCPCVHRVVISPRLGASVVSRRSWLLFGWRHTLELGLPMLRMFPPEEARCIIAHELNHVGRGHSTFGRLVYRTHLFMDALRIVCERADGPIARMTRSYEREASRFRLESEIEADSSSSRFLHPRVACRALSRMALGVARVAALWPEAERCLRIECDRPPADLIDRFAAIAHRPDARDEAWLARALAIRTAASHPTLGERVAAIGLHDDDVRVPDPIPSHESAASAWLGTLHTDIGDHLSHQWVRELDTSWREFRKALPSRHRERAALEARRATLDPEQLRRLAELGATLDGEAQDRAALEDLVAAEPRDLDARARLARLLMQHGSAPDASRAVDMIEELRTKSPERYAEGLDWVAEWHARAGRRAEARLTWRRAHSVREELGDRPTQEPRPDVVRSLQPPRIDCATRTDLERLVHSIPEIDASWVVCADSRRDATRTTHLVIFRMRPSWFGSDRRRTSEVHRKLMSAVADPGRFRFADADSMDAAQLAEIRLIRGTTLRASADRS